MARAELAVREASTPSTADAAPMELKMAREKYERAREKLMDGEYTDARRLAEQATVDAQLARVKADAESARRGAAAVERESGRLSDDVHRTWEDRRR